jgi:hypothetical protein
VSDFLYERTSSNALDAVAAQTVDGVLLDSVVDGLQQTPQTIDLALAWVYLIRRLTDLTIDSRGEVRDGAIHTSLRIFENHGEELSPQVWQLSLRSILLRMMQADLSSYSFGETQNPPEGIDEGVLKGKLGTSQIILEGLGQLLSNHLEQISKSTGFAGIWKESSTAFASYVSLDFHSLNASVFSAISRILSKVPSAGAISLSALQQISDIWDSHIPATKSSLSGTTNHAAFESYVSCLKDIYRLKRDHVTIDDTWKIVSNLERCIRRSDAPSYSTDLDSMTLLQARVVECLSMIRTDFGGATAAVLGLIATFLGLPFEAAEAKQSGTTFIALSKAAMDLLQKLTRAGAAWEEAFSSGHLLAALENLQKSIRVKSQWQRQGRNPALWKKATSTSSAVLQNAIPKLFELKVPQDVSRHYWDVMVGISRNVAHIDGDDPLNQETSQVPDDEDFDVKALKTLSNMMIPALGSPVISDASRRVYARDLFTASLIHIPKRHAINGLDSEPLKDVYKVGLATTDEAEPTVRVVMSYFCYSLLLSLLSSQDSSAAQVKLAQAAAPYVILRAALPLKGYIANQPVRNLFPISDSEQDELVRILGGLRLVKCEPAAIPETQGLKTKFGGHLVRLSPLIDRAVAIPVGDGEVRQELLRWQNALINEFGL